MMRAIRYLWVIARHKWYVYHYGRILGVARWQLLTHDLSKLSAIEWQGYKLRYETGSKAHSEWDVAWHHHWTRNPHHWEYWVYDNRPQSIPEKYLREMVADWCGAALAYRNADGVMGWYLKHGHEIMLTGYDRQFVEELLAYAQWFM